MDTAHEHAGKVDPDRLNHPSYQAYADAAKKAGLAALGRNTVFVGNLHNQSLTIHQIANAFMVAMFDASQVAPGDFKNQILTFQDEVRVLLTKHLREATRIEGERIGLMLEANGHSNAASLVRSTLII